MLPEIQKELERLLKSAGAATPVELSVPPHPELGDFAYPCFTWAKDRGENPARAAAALSEKIGQKISRKSSGLVDKVKSFGPYVNFFLNGGALAKLALFKIKKAGDGYGQTTVGKRRRVMIEYPSQNSHKEFHIGHLRNVCIGNSLVALFRASGYKVVPVNYVNDFGAHVVRCLWGIINFHSGEKPPAKDRQRWLGEVYAEASQYLKDHPERQTELDGLQVKLEARDPSVWPLFMETRDWSAQGFGSILRELGAVHDEIFYEVDVKERGQEMVDELLKMGIARVGDKGAVIIDLTAEGLDIALLRKSSGAGLYLTSDLALAEKKFSAHEIEESVNITGSEQDFYFKQLFKVLELAGFKHKMTHIGYGLVNLPAGKMSSRAGNVILYEDLRDRVLEHLQSEVAQRHPDWPDRKQKDTAQTLALAVLKFTMQKHEAAKVITFNFADAVSFEGFSAPYILYVVARINSLARKAEVKKPAVDFSVLSAPVEKGLILMLASFPNLVAKARSDYNPAVVAKYAFDLAQCFNEFYRTQPVLQAGAEALIAARLYLCLATRQVLTSALSLLSIDTVEEM